VGHLNGLARTTTKPDTFIYMAADTVHHGGEFRPSYLQPLPSTPIDAPGLDPDPAKQQKQILGLHPKHSQTETFLEVSHDFPDDYEPAMQTIEKLQAFDADEKVFVVFAHDTGLLDVVDTYPQRANEWKEKGWREKTLWRFIGQLATDAKKASRKTE
jgi:hypothetical protein